VRAGLIATLLIGALAGAAPAAAHPGAPAPSQLGPARAVRPRASLAARRGPTVSAVLQSLLQSGSITQATYLSDLDTYIAAKHAAARLTGTRRAELAAVVQNAQEIAASGQLTASLQASVFLTLQRNTEYWRTEPLLSYGARVKFPPSDIVWEYYPGQGIEIQWLATFGEGNGYFLSGNQNTRTRDLIAELISLATDQASGITWDYLFHFDGGAPPWTSGLSQGTALQLLSRAYSRYKGAEYLAAAKSALGIFATYPPAGVRVPTSAGNLYAEYSFAPGDHILNGFIQADVGLYDYSQITGDPIGLALFEAGDSEARAEVPHYNTGSWSLYDQFGESDLGYHELLEEFLQHLCERTRRGEPLPAPVAGPPATGPTGGAAAQPAPKSAVVPVAQIAGDQIYCSTAAAFEADLHTPPVITLVTHHVRTGERAGIRVALSKISTVTMTISRSGKVVWSVTASVPGGKPRLLWVTPARGGTFTVSLTAVDLAGNSSSASGRIVVHRP